MKQKRILVILFALALASLMNPASAFICDNVQFFDQCPTSDPIFPKIVSDFKIRKDGVLIDATTLSCTAPISTMPISTYTDELVLMQALRTIYYMDLGRTNHLPWTSKSLYDWMKDKIGGFSISSTATFDSYTGQEFLGVGDSTNYFEIRAKNDATRDAQRRWAGPAGISTAITLMMHERRHADGSIFNHTTCCAAQVPGQPAACDQTYEETSNISPYGVQYWLEKNWVTGYINVGVGCITPAADQTTAINWMRQDGNIHMTNYCSNPPPPLTNANNQPTCTCAPGSTTGEPHIRTLDGLYYDFQAAGDFLLTENGPSFIVQVRQRWTPNRPNVAFNKAVAMQMGKTRVAVFLDPTRLVVDGSLLALADGKTISRPDVEVTRNANVYTIKHIGMETVRVEAVDSVWVSILGGHFLDVSVSLNYAANGKMRGLLGNGNGDMQDDFVTRDGTLAQPASFEAFYHRYAPSMSIRPEESLFGEKRSVHIGREPRLAVTNVFEAPKKSFTVKDLSPREYKSARASCIKADVKDESILDACTLDVAVLRSPKVAKRYAGVAAPAAIFEPGVGIRLLPAVPCKTNQEGTLNKDTSEKLYRP